MSNNLPSSPDEYGGVLLKLPPLFAHASPNKARSVREIDSGGMVANFAINIDSLRLEQSLLCFYLSPDAPSRQFSPDSAKHLHLKLVKSHSLVKELVVGDLQN